MNRSTARRIVTLAEEMSKAFTGLTRDNGDKIRVLKDGSPEWMTDIVRSAHGDMLPDDQRYAFTEEAVDAIAGIDADDADEDAIQEAGDGIEADIYTGELTEWLGSRNDRYSYVDQAIEEYGPFDSVIASIGAGQYTEKREVFQAVVQALTEHVEAEDDSDEDEDGDEALSE